MLLREGAGSLLACEAIERGSGEDSKDEKDAVRQSVKDFLNLYGLRSAVAQFVASHAASMDPVSKPTYGTVNWSQEGSPHESKEKSLNNKKIDLSSSSVSGGDKFVWTIQGYVRFVNKATDMAHKDITALME